MTSNSNCSIALSKFRPLKTKSLCIEIPSYAAAGLADFWTPFAIAVVMQFMKNVLGGENLGVQTGVLGTMGK